MKQHKLLMVFAGMVSILVFLNCTAFAETQAEQQLAKLRKLKSLTSKSYGIAVPETDYERDGILFKKERTYLVKNITTDYVLVRSCLNRKHKTIAIPAREFQNSFSFQYNSELLADIDERIEKVIENPSAINTATASATSAESGMRSEEKQSIWGHDFESSWLSDGNPERSNSVENDSMTITTKQGATFENCKITRIEPDGISFSHSKGVAKIPFHQLPYEFSKKYGYDPDEAKRYAKNIRKDRMEYRQRVQSLEAKRNREFAKQYESARKNPIYHTVAAINENGWTYGEKSSKNNFSGSLSGGRLWPNVGVGGWSGWRGGGSTSAGEYDKIIRGIENLDPSYRKKEYGF